MDHGAHNDGTILFYDSVIVEDAWGFIEWVRWILQVIIKYCRRWNYRSAATGLEAKIKKEIAIDVKLIEGEVGVFDIFFNNEFVFSKAQEGRFPTDEEILESLKLILQSNQME